MRIMISPIVALIMLLAGTSSAVRKLQAGDTCTATLVATQVIVEGKHKMELGLTCVLPGEKIYEVAVDDSFIEDNFVNGPYKSSYTEFDIPVSAAIDSGTITVPDKSAIVLRRKEKGTDGSLNKAVKTVLVVRIECINDSTTASEAQLSNGVLGTNGDEVNIKSQTNLCSHGELTYTTTPNRNSVDNRPNIRNGATTVSVNLRTQVGDADVRRAVNAELEVQFDVDEASELADHVLYCMPPGTMTNSFAYAYINHWLSVYGDNGCLYPSAQMHEVGHNLGLSHSGEGNNEYADATCMMGFSYGDNEGPKMCYNAPKAWQLGWYPTKRITISPGNAAYTGELAGYIEDPNSNSVPPMLVKIDVDNSDIDYYIYFNRADGFMEGSQMAKNKVLISIWDSSGYNDSYIQAKMEAGDSWDIPGYPNGKVIVDSIGTRASVRIFLNSQPTPSPTPCSGSILSINVKTDAFSSETFWTLTEVNSGTVILENPTPIEENFLYEQSVCGSAGTCFEFVMIDTYGDGICCENGEGYYEFFANGNLIGTGGAFGSSATEVYCGDDNTPSPVGDDSPTQSPVGGDSPTQSPVGDSQCSSSQNSVKVLITTDNRPGQTSWSLYNADTQGIILQASYESSDRNESFEYDVCVDSSVCLEFQMSDSQGNGICCLYGNGSFQVTYDDVVVAEGGEFLNEYVSTQFGCSSSPTAAPVPCTDSGFRLGYKENAGGTSFPCAFVGELVSDCICSDLEVSSHCKSSCNSCAEYECVDSTASWYIPTGPLTGQVANCGALSELGPSQVTRFCNLVEDLRVTCPVSCGVCG